MITEMYLCSICIMYVCMYAIVRMLFVVSIISICHFLFSVYISGVCSLGSHKMKASALTT